jgi:undecaprenyl-diphosphatase
VLAGVVTLAAGAVLARSGRVSAREQRWFQAVNHLPSWGHAPTWTVMQLGSVGGALGVSAVVAATGRPSLGRRMAVAGWTAWVAAKAVKRAVGRRRPSATEDIARLIGRPAPGLGYPSGHAAVAAALAAAAAPELPTAWRRGAWVMAAFVGPARMYVGAHLPLDIVGGAALGIAIGTTSRHTRWLA